MANLRDIKRRIKSVKNTAKITRAMQLVAASKMKRAQDQAIANRPYAQLMAEFLAALSGQIGDVKHPFLEKREIKKRGVLVVSTEKGLCGPLNANLFRRLTEIKDAAAYVAIGRKAVQFISRTGRELLADFSIPDTAPFSTVRPVVEFMVNAYKAGEIDTIEVLFTQFINTLKQDVVIERLAPIDDLGKMIADFEKVQDYTADAPMANDQREFKFEPSADVILHDLLDLYLKREVYHMVLEAKASEHSARMVAMKTATDNAKKLVESLTLDYNKARQAAITQEILEIAAATANS